MIVRLPGRFDSIEAAARALREEVDRCAVSLGKPGGPAGLRIEAVVPDTDPLAWLHAHEHLIQMYCSNRERRLQIAAMGCADRLRLKEETTPLREALQEVFDRLHKLPDGVRYYGGMRFMGDAPPDDPAWQRFGRIRFVLPALELIRDEEKTTLAANLVASPDLSRELNLLHHQLRGQCTPSPLPAAHLPQPVHRSNTPDREAWGTLLMEAFPVMQRGDLQKVVLARRCNFDFQDPLLPMALLQRLHECTPDSFHFCFNYGNEIAFIGASPERLYRRKGTAIASEALAGTRPRGATPEDDAWLASELMASTKERREHSLVAEAITGVLRRHCSSVTCGQQPEVLALRHVQHLRTVITGVLREPVSDADLLLSLHPTPAVGGWPVERALRAIADLEPFDRGWYCAPIGWAMKDEAEFAVAIRCGLVEGKRLSVFSGAGIMPESNPEQEWREIECKISNFLRILTS